jgi:hypothetical protein
VSKKYGLRTVKFWVRFDPVSSCVVGRAFRTKKDAKRDKPDKQITFQVKGHYMRKKLPGKSFGYSA